MRSVGDVRAPELGVAEVASEALPERGGAHTLIVPGDGAATVLRSTLGVIVRSLRPQPQIVGLRTGAQSDQCSRWAVPFLIGRAPATARGKGLADERLPRSADRVGQG